MMFGWDHSWGAGEWLVMSLMMLVFWGALIAVVVSLIRSTRSGPNDDARASTSAPPPTPTAHADEVLAERFARGDIDEDEFKSRREVLHSASARD